MEYEIKITVAIFVTICNKYVILSAISFLIKCRTIATVFCSDISLIAIIMLTLMATYSVLIYTRQQTKILLSVI